MDGRSDPPSSVHRFDVAARSRACTGGELWSPGAPAAAAIAVELTGVHAAFARMGFVRTGTTAHPGFDPPTSLTMERAL